MATVNTICMSESIFNLDTSSSQHTIMSSALVNFLVKIWGFLIREAGYTEQQKILTDVDVTG